MAHIDKLIHSIEIGGTLYEIHDANAIHAIEDLNLSSVLKFGGVVANRVALPAASADNEGYVYHIKDEDTEVVCVNIDGAYHWEDFGHAIVTDHIHDITLTPTTDSASKMVTAGSVNAGSAASFTPGEFNPGSFTQGTDTFNAGSFTPGSVDLDYTAPSYVQGTDSFTPNSPTKIDTSKFSGGSASFTQGEDEFTPNTPTIINTSKFNAGSASLSAGSYTAPSATFNPGSHSFTPNNPTVIDTSKFSGGSVSQTDIVYTSPILTGEAVDAEVANGVLKLTAASLGLTGGSVTGGKVTHTAAKFNSGFYTAGSAASASYTAPTLDFKAGSYSAPTLNYTAPSLGDGFYTAGSAASFTQGVDSHSFTPAKLNTGFYTAGSAATFAQGTDTFSAGSASINETEAKWTAPTFTQGKDTYVAPTHTADTFVANKPTTVTLPTFSTVNNLWTGATATTGLPKQPE